jgi:predicted nucleotidyltransferase
MSGRGNGGCASDRVATNNGSTGVPNADDSLPPSGPTLQQAFDALVSTLNERGVRYAIVGGLAIIQHGRVRTTDDIDAILAIPQVAMPGLFEALRERGFTLDVMNSVRELRDHGLTTLQFHDVLIDLMRPVLPLYEHVLDRSIETIILGHRVRISSVESLIVMKLIALRPQDQADIQDLLTAYAGEVDLNYIRNELDAVMTSDDHRRMMFETWVSHDERAS